MNIFLSAPEINAHVDSIQSYLGDELRRLRRSRHLSVDDVALLFLKEDGEKYRLSGKTILNIERNKHDPRFRDILSLIYHLGGDPSAMIMELAKPYGFLIDDEKERESIRQEINLGNRKQARKLLQAYKDKHVACKNQQRRQFILWMESLLSHTDDTHSAVSEARLLNALMATLPKITDSKGKLNLDKLEDASLTLQEYRILVAIAYARGGEEAITLYQLLYNIIEDSITISEYKRNEMLISLHYNTSFILLELNPVDPRILEVCEKAIQMSVHSKCYDLLGRSYFNLGRFYYHQENLPQAKKSFQRSHDTFVVMHMYDSAEKTFKFALDNFGIELTREAY